MLPIISRHIVRLAKAAALEHVTTAMTTMDMFDYTLRSRGWMVFERVIEPQLTIRLKEDLARKQQECRAWQLRNGLAQGTEGTAHHILGSNNSLDEFLERLFLDAEIRDYFGGNPYILNSYGGVINNLPGESAYVQRVHRDQRTFSGDFPLMLNMLVMLDEFSIDNGATRVLSGSHRTAQCPSDDHFDAYADYMLAPEGSIALFNSNLWHCGAPNKSGRDRYALTLTFSRPFFKQQMDYPRFLGEKYLASRSEKLQQLLGYHSRVPSSYEEWYQPPEKRMYRPGQG